jgi:hypothetical protein
MDNIISAPLSNDTFPSEPSWGIVSHATLTTPSIASYPATWNQNDAVILKFSLRTIVVVKTYSAER